VNDSFTIDAKDDDLAEGDEQFTLTLGQDWTEASTYEDVDYDTSAVSTTIVDDDNGTITVSAEIQVGENLITNGSFEQFPGSIADGGQKAFQSVDGWTIYSGDEMQIHSGSHNMSGGPNAVPLGAADGDYYMDMESSPNAIGIEQTISGLDAGNLYNLSFSVADKALADPGYYANNPQLGEYQGTTSTILEVYWNGGLVKTIHTGTTEWLEFSFDLVAQGGDNTLRFVEIGVDGDNHGSALDDIKLVDKAALLDIQGTVDNVSDGETVTLTITDGTNSQVVTTTVSGGQYTYDDFDITGWNEADIDVHAETTDTGGNTVTADTSVSKDITATVSDDSGSVTEDATATATGNVLDNDSDADTVLTVTGAGTYEGAYGTLILQANGDYTYTLDNGADKVQALDDNETVVDTFTYTAQDGAGNDHSANLVITINGADEPNVAPTSTNDSVSTPEGVNLTLSLNDFGVYADADNDALAAVKITALPVNGTLLLNSVAVQAGDEIAATQVSQGNLVFVPADSDTDADSAFQFQVQDAAGLWSGTYTTDVAINAVADQPNVAITLGEPQGETPEVTDLPTAISHVKYMLSDGTTLKFEPYDANITDPTDPTQYIEAIETATGETVTAYYIKSANNVYDAWGNYVGGAINGDASNPLANQSDATDAPSGYAAGSTYVFGGASATYDYPVTVTASLNDTDGSESLTLWVTGVPQGASLQGASYNSQENRWELTTETDPEAETEVQLVLEGVPAGSSDFTLTATAVATESNPAGAVDTLTATNTATAGADVPDVNDPPEFGQTSYSESYQENSATSVVLETVTATDPEGGAVSYAITANVQDGAGNDLFAIDSSGNITLTADGAAAFTNDYEASGNTHVLTVTAFDSQGNTTDVQVTLTETNIADQLKQGDNTDNTLSTVGGDNDVLIGDAGGNQTNFDQGTNYNISLIVDTSGSMQDRMALTEAALKNLADTLVNHSGSVNLQIVEFGSDLKSNVTFNDIDTSDLSAIESAIEALDDGSYTNYEAGFRAAEDWFSNQSNGYENMAFFLTDGEPNRYLDNSGNVRSGSDSSPEVMQESVEAFADLTALGVTVHGIGIGTGVTTNTLRFFDNTQTQGNAVIGEVVSLLADFNSGWGATEHALDENSDWSFSSTGWNSEAEVNGWWEELSLYDDPSDGIPATATSQGFAVTDGQSVRFSYNTDGYGGQDYFRWTLQVSDGNGGWSTVQTAEPGESENNWTDITSNALSAGTYRLVFQVENGGGQGDGVDIDDIQLVSPVTAPYGQPQTVTDGDQLTAVLQGGNTVVTPHDVGDDILIGGDGDDIIFGDAVEHADFAGQGTEGLFNAIEQDEGLSNPSASQVHQYLVDNEADLIFPAGQGGDDELTGGRGNDLLIGGEGQDRFVWKAGDQGTEDHPAEDHVADFELGTDKLDLSDLFDIAAGKSIDDYLFAATEGGDTKLYVNTKGDFNGSQDKNLADQVITLDDQNTDLNTLINNNGLITD
jgi:VCBS repeat-containing protein